MPRRAPGRSLTAHRPSRDTQKAQELTDLKRENHQLRRRVARLQKQVEHLELLSPEEAEAREDLPAAPEVLRCESCGSSQFLSFTTPSGKTISGCRSCQTPRPS